jgi:hypothetical protein
VGFHAAPRFTKDIDLWIGSTTDDLDRIEAALRRFGAPEATVASLRELKGLDVAWMGNPPLRFDFMKEVPGGVFEACYPRRVASEWGGVPVSVVGADDLLRLKRASGRPQDLVDADALEALRR